MSKLSGMIEKGGAWVPARICIYADEKFGKTTQAGHAPKPLFHGTDDGRKRIKINGEPIEGLPIVEDWSQFLEQLAVIEADAAQAGYKSVVLDTLNGVVDLCAQHICETQFGGKWNDPKYGFLAWGGHQGWKAVAEEFRQVLTIYDRLVDQGLWIILLSHTITSKVKNPLEGDYDRFQPAVHKHAWNPIAQWADVILRGDYAYTILEEENDKKVITDSQKRIFRCAPGLAESAGCRGGFELPATMPAEWSEIESRLGQNAGGEAAELQSVLEAMMLAEDGPPRVKKILQHLGVASIKKVPDAPISKTKTVLKKLRAEVTSG